MKYIFEDNCEVGELPIKNIQITWYDMIQNGTCFDEYFIEPKDFNVYDLMHVSNEDNEDDYDKTRVFINLLDGRQYELLLRKV